DELAEAIAAETGLTDREAHRVAADAFQEAQDARDAAYQQRRTDLEVTIGEVAAKTPTAAPAPFTPTVTSPPPVATGPRPPTVFPDGLRVPAELSDRLLAYARSAKGTPLSEIDAMLDEVKRLRAEQGI